MSIRLQQRPYGGMNVVCVRGGETLGWIRYVEITSSWRAYACDPQTDIGVLLNDRPTRDQAVDLIRNWALRQRPCQHLT